MRGYMPREHRRVLEELDGRRGAIRAFVLAAAAAAGPQGAELKETYNACVVELEKFR
jgi:hypothetical protein